MEMGNESIAHRKWLMHDFKLRIAEGNESLRIPNALIPLGKLLIS
jgi:hypothetical protein